MIPNLNILTMFQRIRITVFIKCITYFFMLTKRLISPPFCAACHSFLKDYTIFCSNCFTSIKPVTSSVINITDSYKVWIFAVSSYDGPIKKLLLSKDYYAPAMSRQLGQLIIMRTPFLSRPCDIIVPIPLHWTRKIWRGYNQSEIMAQELARTSHKPVVQLLTRSRRTQLQRDLTQIERQKNVCGVFTLSSMHHKYHNKHIALIDDVYTTGSTVQEAIKILRITKPASITVYVVSRVLD